jgi:hypothetical protein
LIRETSLEAFHTIKENGLLSERRWRVYEIVFTFGPMIGSKVAEIYQANYGKTSASETIRNRLTELRDSGAIKEVGKTLDPKTGMKVLLWDVTSKLPEKIDRKKKTKCPWCHGSGEYSP